MHEELNALLSAIERFRRIDPVMPSQMIATLLIVRMKPGISMNEIAKRLGLSQSAPTRHLTMFNTSGHGLLTAEYDENNRCRKCVRLTPKGLSLLNDVRKALVVPMFDPQI